MRKFIYIGLVLAAVIAVYVYSEYNKAPQTAEDKKSDFMLSVSDFSNDFTNNTTNADAKYKNKTIELTGIVSEVNINGNNTDVLLETEDPMMSINVQLTPTNSQHLTIGEEVTLKAIYVGVLTDLGTDIELNQATILKK
ncbi:MAG: OB-fold protein [Bacteroidia bacterium]